MKPVRITVAATLLAPLALAAFAQVPKPASKTPVRLAAGAKLSSVPQPPNVSKYRSWGAVNAEPYEVPSRLSMLCRVPTGQDLAAMLQEERKVNPHAAYHIRVYVTPATAKEAFRLKKNEFPVGTTVVKEKLASATAKTPELLTVMVKRKKGYDKAGGDWQYYVLNGSGTKILANSRLKQCRDCHQERKTQGFLFRNYVTFDQSAATKSQERISRLPSAKESLVQIASWLLSVPIRTTGVGSQRGDPTALAQG